MARNKKLSDKYLMVLTAVLLSVNLFIIYLFTGIMDWGTWLLYLLVGMILVYYFKQYIKTGFGFGFFGASINISYNLLGLLFGWFAVSMTFIAIGALQQGIIFYLVSKIMGVK